MVVFLNSAPREAENKMTEIAEEFAGHGFSFDEEARLSVSFGIACAQEFNEMSTLIAAAELRMRNAKGTRALIMPRARNNCTGTEVPVFLFSKPSVLQFFYTCILYLYSYVSILQTASQSKLELWRRSLAFEPVKNQSFRGMPAMFLYRQ